MAATNTGQLLSGGGEDGAEDPAGSQHGRQPAGAASCPQDLAGKLCAELQRRGCDIGRTTYAKYEAGELNIRASVLIELRRFYGCRYDDFFAGLDGEE